MVLIIYLISGDNDFYLAYNPLESIISLLYPNEKLYDNWPAVFV